MGGQEFGRTGVWEDRSLGGQEFERTGVWDDRSLREKNLKKMSSERQDLRRRGFFMNRSFGE